MRMELDCTFRYSKTPRSFTIHWRRMNRFQNRVILWIQEFNLIQMLKFRMIFSSESNTSKAIRLDTQWSDWWSILDSSMGVYLDSERTRLIAPVISVCLRTSWLIWWLNSVKRRIHSNSRPFINCWRSVSRCAMESRIGR